MQLEVREGGGRAWGRRGDGQIAAGPGVLAFPDLPCRGDAERLWP